MVCLPQHVGNTAQVGGKLLGIPGQAGSVFDQARDRVLFQVAQPFRRGQRTEHPGVQNIIFLITRNLVIKIHCYFKQILKIRVVLQQHVIKQTVPYQDNLDIQGNGFRFQGHRADEAESPFKGFNPDFSGFHCTFKAFPCIRLHENLSGIEYQITAVGPVQCPGLDQCEISYQCPHVGLMFRSSNQVGMVGVVFKNNRSRVPPAVVHQDIHGITPIAICSGCCSENG